MSRRIWQKCSLSKSLSSLQSQTLHLTGFVHSKANKSNGRSLIWQRNSSCLSKISLLKSKNSLWQIQLEFKKAYLQKKIQITRITRALRQDKRDTTRSNSQFKQICVFSRQQGNRLLKETPVLCKDKLC